MTEDLPEDPDTDESVKKAFESAMRSMSGEDVPEKDPFDTDALGHTPAEEDDRGGD